MAPTGDKQRKAKKGLSKGAVDPALGSPKVRAPGSPKPAAPASPKSAVPGSPKPSAPASPKTTAPGSPKQTAAQSSKNGGATGAPPTGVDLDAYAALELGKGDVVLSSRTDEELKVRKAKKKDPRKEALKLTSEEKDLLTAKLESIEYKAPAELKRIPWIETLCIPIPMKIDQKDLQKKDVLREKKFHDMAMSAVRESYRRLKVMNVPASRPGDFLAEMFKTDAHMLRVRTRLAEEQRRLQVVEDRKKFKADKRMHKRIQSEKAKEKAKKKVAALNSVQKWKKERTGKGVDSDGAERSLDKALDALDRKSSSSTPMERSEKRVAKEKKFGPQGGRKREKQNTRADLDGPMKSLKTKKGGKGKGKGGGKGGKGGGKGGRNKK